MENAGKDTVFDDVLCMEIMEKKCAVCAHRRIIGEPFGETVYGCFKGKTWPNIGVCKSIKLDEERG